MSQINILPQNLVNKIAAGEVVERPASVVKELMENSLDAGSNRVDVSIEDGGKKLIQIQDDGIGMDYDDLARCVIPHATSKLSCEEDLFNIGTMGFRGEAIASIASISQMEIVSRVRGGIEANKIVIDGGDVREHQPASGPEGTTFSIRNLFYNTPARRKFLKTTNTEFNHISEQFTRIALANEAVHFTLSHNGRKIKELPGDQGLRERIGSLFSKELSDDLLSIARQDRGVSVSGMIGRPQQARSGSQWQYVFVNGRFIRDKFISHAIREGYRSMMEVNRQPVVFLFINVAPDQVDVNVHPTKIEVRFADSNTIHSQVLAAIRDKLLGGNMAVDIKAASIARSSDNEGQSDVDASENASQTNAVSQEALSANISDGDKSQDARKALLDFFNKRPQQAEPQQQMSFKSYDRPAPASSVNEFPSTRQPFENVDAGASGNESISSSTTVSESTSFTENEEHFEGRFMQVHNSFIIQQTENGFEITDQHALHERIMYEILNDRFLNGNMPSQRLLIPETVDVTPDQLAVIEANQETLSDLGIELEQFGPGTIAIQSFPQLMEKANPSEVVVEMLDKLTENSGKLSREELLHSILDMMACKAAVKAGDPLTDDEIEELLVQRHKYNRNSNCPHGRPTTITISLPELRKMFKRT